MWHTASSDLGAHIWMKLIELVRQHPTIYLPTKKRSSKLRRNRNEINEIWEDIAAQIGFSVEDSKRRWKGLKDVYSKIQKRRVQEDVLGIKARKKWLYEDAMSFMKFPFEQMYQKALENLQVDSDDWKMQDADSVETKEEHSNENLESIDVETREHSISEDQTEDCTEEYLDLYLEVDAVPEPDKYISTQSSVKDNGANDKSPVQVSPLRENCGRDTETKSRFKYREIRPKPYQPDLTSKSRSIRSGTAAIIENNPTSAFSFVNLSSSKRLNQMIVSPSILQRSEDCNTVILAGPNINEESGRKTRSIDVTSTSSVVGPFRQKSSKNRSVDFSVSPANKYTTLLDSPRKKSNGSSIELFFKSMARTVMNLPTRAQAEIKMEICKLVTRAEIQYSLSHSPSKLESRKFKIEEG